MSMNFELLQKLGKHLGICEVEISSFPPTPLESQAPPLEMQKGQRDAVMNLVQQLFLMPGLDEARTVVLAGTEPGNGCSWICSRAAETLASQVGRPVCIVDANFRSPGIHEYFGVNNHHGLSDALQATDSLRNYVFALGRQKLSLLSCGGSTTRAVGLLGSDRMRARLAEMREYFSYVLIDAPALSLTNDSIVLGRAVDGVVLVLKANSSRREVVRKAVHNLEGAGVRIFGAVLNQRTYPIPQAIYNKL